MPTSVTTSSASGSRTSAATSLETSCDSKRGCSLSRKYFSNSPDCVDARSQKRLRRMKRPLFLSVQPARDRILVISRSRESRPPIAGTLDHPRQNVAEVDTRDAARRLHAIAERSYVEAQVPQRPVALRVFTSRTLSIESHRPFVVEQ